MAPTKEFSVTFGGQYAYIPHPFDARIHPEGWAVVEAVDEREARAMVYELMGVSWAFVYAGPEPRASGLYQRGEILRIRRFGSMTVVRWPGDDNDDDLF